MQISERKALHRNPSRSSSERVRRHIGKKDTSFRIAVATGTVFVGAVALYQEPNPARADEQGPDAAILSGQTIPEITTVFVTPTPTPQSSSSEAIAADVEVAGVTSAGPDADNPDAASASASQDAPLIPEEQLKDLFAQQSTESIDVPLATATPVPTATATAAPTETRNPNAIPTPDSYTREHTTQIGPLLFAKDKDVPGAQNPEYGVQREEAVRWFEKLVSTTRKIDNPGLNEVMNKFLYDFGVGMGEDKAYRATIAPTYAEGQTYSNDPLKPTSVLKVFYGDYVPPFQLWVYGGLRVEATRKPYNQPEKDITSILQFHRAAVNSNNFQQRYDEARKKPGFNPKEFIAQNTQPDQLLADDTVALSAALDVYEKILSDPKKPLENNGIARSQGYDQWLRIRDELKKTYANDQDSYWREFRKQVSYNRGG